MIWGMDYLGGAMFRNELLKAHPTGWAAGFFAETFGDCWPVVERLCRTRRCPLVRIHGPWTNHAYDPKRHDKAIFAAFDEVRVLSQKYPNIEFQFSPVCECDATSSAWFTLFDRLRKVSHDTVPLICSVGSKGKIVFGVTGEVHGPTKPPAGPYQYSFDGTSTVDSDVEAYKKLYSRAQVLFFWHPAFNLKYKTELSGDEPANVKRNDSAPPLRRECRPSPNLISSLAALSATKGNVKLSPRTLWKSHADRHETPAERRAYKPVLITPAHTPSVFLKDPNGLVVAKSTGREPYADGRWRYYFDKFGYQISHQVLTIHAGDSVIGTVNPAFREGEYRS